MKGQYKLHHEIKSRDVPVGDYQSHICNNLDHKWRRYTDFDHNNFGLSTLYQKIKNNFF